jgi:hypothetical protein
MAKLSIESMKDIVFYYNSLDKQYRHLSDSRWSTFKIAMNLFAQRNLSVVVETGCARLPDDWGGGQSTLLFGELCSKVEGGRLYTVDINKRNIEMCQTITTKFKGIITYTVQDSVEYLLNFQEPLIDLLYLDSYDYPDGQIVNLYGGMSKYESIMAKLGSISESEVVEKHGELLAPCQMHCLKEYEAAKPKLHDHSIVLIDDNNLPGGGKARLVKDQLIKDGWICLLDYQQSVWIRS